MTRYLSCAETAKLIRKQLKAKFPTVKFGVRSSVYAGGASINVDWTDGPTADMVDAVVKPFAGGGFDSMIDMKYSVEAFLLPDGSASFAQTSGTAGAMGTVSAAKSFKPCAEAERVRFGADYVFTRRNASRRLVEGALLSFRAHWGEDEAAKISLREWSDGSCHASSSDFDTQQRFYRLLNRRVIAA